MNVGARGRENLRKRRVAEILILESKEQSLSLEGFGFVDFGMWKKSWGWCNIEKPMQIIDCTLHS